MRRPRRATAAPERTDIENRLRRLVASNVRRLRAARGWTQEEAAHRCDLVTSVLQRIEAGGANLTLASLAHLCAGFELSGHELFEPADIGAPRRRGRPRGSRAV